MNMPKKEKYNKDIKYKVSSIDGQDIYLTEFLFAKQRGMIDEFVGHTDIAENYYKLLPFLLSFKLFDEELKNIKDDRRIFTLFDGSNRRIFHIVDENMCLVSVFIVSGRNFEKQLNRRFEYINKNLNGGAATSHILSPARPFWRHLDLIEQLYHNFERNTISQDVFIKIVDRIMDNKKLDKNTKYLEKLIDKLVYKLYHLTKNEIEIIEKK